MKKTTTFLALLMALAVSAQSTWKSDRAHSKVGFAISHMMIAEVEGSFGEFEITATADDAFAEPNFTVNIASSSIDTDNERRDGHLKSADFFEVETYPTIEFTTTGYEKTGDNTFTLTGDLTMHGVTKPVTLEGRLNGVITDQRSQKLKAGLKLTGTVNRKEFGVGSKPFPVGEEVDITVHLEMAQQ